MAQQQSFSKLASEKIAAPKEKKIWNTRLVEEAKRMIDDGFDVPNPFVESDYQWRKPDIIFDYTDEEVEEIRKCASDIAYFANKYAYSMTDGGIQKITLRDYQEQYIRDLQSERFNIAMMSRQTGKCFTFDSRIDVKYLDGRIETISMGELFYQMLKEVRSLSFKEKITLFLWRAYSRVILKLERKS